MSKCAACEEDIESDDDSHELIGKQWHQDCIKCNKCAKLLIGLKVPISRLRSTRLHVRTSVLLQIVPKDGKLWCEGCVPQQASGFMCKICSQSIVGASAKVGDDRFHPTCFVCADCKIQLGGQTFFPKDDKTFCQRCMEAKVGTCSGCLKPVIKNPIRALAKAWHRECFTYGPVPLERLWCVAG